MLKKSLASIGVLGLAGSAVSQAKTGLIPQPNFIYQRENRPEPNLFPRHAAVPYDVYGLSRYADSDIYSDSASRRAERSFIDTHKKYGIDDVIRKTKMEGDRFKEIVQSEEGELTSTCNWKDGMYRKNYTYMETHEGNEENVDEEFVDINEVENNVTSSDGLVTFGRYALLVGATYFAVRLVKNAIDWFVEGDDAKNKNDDKPRINIRRHEIRRFR